MTLTLGIVTHHFVETCEFFFENFGFRPVSIDADRAQLAGPRGEQLALLRAGDDEQPAALQSATRGMGLWLEVRVNDVSGCFDRMRRAGAEIVADLEAAEEDDARFVVRDPNGVLVVVKGTRAPTDFLSPTLSRNRHDQNHRHSIHGLSRHRHETRPGLL